MSTKTEWLEQQANLLFENIAGWEQRTLQYIGARIKKTGKMSMADVRQLNNMAVVKQDMDVIIKDLARVTGYNISELERIYGAVIDSEHNASKVLFDYRNEPFVPLAENTQLQALVKAYSRTTGETMINLSKTKALGFVDGTGAFRSVKDTLYNALGKATMEVATGTTDFNTAMRKTIEEIGGSGIRVNYGSGITRRLDTVVRQNILWGAKQASKEYHETVGEQLDCDGIEIDWHSNPRPDHVFMQGRQFSLHGKKTVNGITYESADAALEALEDYGCLHFKTSIILGVSEPAYSPEQLAELNRKNSDPIEIEGVTKTGYEWKQSMRQLETEARKCREQITIAKAVGNKDLERKYRQRLKSINTKYTEIADATGIKAQPEKMRVYGKTVGKLDSAGKSATRNTNIYLTYNPNADFTVELRGLKKEVNEGISKASQKVAEMGGKTGKEHLSLINLDSGVEEFFESGDAESVGSNKFWDFVLQNREKSFAFIHNHNTDGYFSETDMRTLLNNKNIKIFGAIRIDGVKYFAEKTTELNNLYYFDPLFKEELNDLNYQVRNGIITAGERTHRREEIIVDGLLKKYTKGLVEIDGRK